MYFKWDMREQQYKELKEKVERDAAVKPEQQSWNGGRKLKEISSSL